MKKNPLPLFLLTLALVLAFGLLVTGCGSNLVHGLNTLERVFDDRTAEPNAELDAPLTIEPDRNG